VRDAGTGEPLPDPQECAERLVYTELDRYLIAETMHRRLQDPPFTGQLDHEAHVQRFAGEMEALRARGESGAVEAVLQRYERALANHEVSWRVRERYATIERRAGDLDVAEDEWRRLAREFPQYPSFELQLARTLGDEGRYAEAEAALQRVLDYREEPSTLLELAAVVARQGQTTRAAAILGRVLKLTVEGDPVRQRASEALEALGEEP
jgi:tetratricopeptide (TPR) repeat protein